MVRPEWLLPPALSTVHGISGKAQSKVSSHLHVFSHCCCRACWRLILGLPSMVPSESDVCLLVALELGSWPPHLFTWCGHDCQFWILQLMVLCGPGPCPPRGREGLVRTVRALIWGVLSVSRDQREATILSTCPGHFVRAQGAFRRRLPNPHSQPVEHTGLAVLVLFYSWGNRGSERGWFKEGMSQS